MFKPQVRRTIWHTEFIGDLVLVNGCPFEGGDVGQSMHWHTECIMRMMFRSWSLAVQILVRERLEARYEELKSQTGNRPSTLAIMRKHQLVEAAVTELFCSRDRAERETVGQLRLALRELLYEEEELQPERKKLLPLAGRDSESKRSRNWLWNGTSPSLDLTASSMPRRR